MAEMSELHGTSTQSSARAVRSSRWGRLAMLGGMAAGLAGDVVGSAARVGRLPDGVAAELHRRVAAQLLERLGEMKGLPMKLGQMLSYMEDFVPAEHRQVYRETLSQLRVRVQPMAWEAMAAVIEEELGALPEQLFASIDPEPVAAASIGQVYRARLHDGRAVAVKVQYPGVAQAIESDLENVDLLLSTMSAVFPRVEMEVFVDDVMSRLREECDYLAEAESQKVFARLWADDPEVVVPSVVDELCSAQVLVTEYADGQSWEEMLAASPADERSAYGRTIFRFVYGSLYGHGILNADPHPGNYVFLGDGRVAFLDFGCVQRYPAEDVAAHRRLLDAVVTGVRGAPLYDLICRAWGYPAALPERLRSEIESFVLLSCEPFSAEQPYAFDRALTERLTRMAMEAKMEISKSVLVSGRWDQGYRQGVVFLHRLSFGVASILASLGADGDWPALLAAELQRRL